MTETTPAGTTSEGRNSSKENLAASAVRRPDRKPRSAVSLLVAALLVAAAFLGLGFFLGSQWGSDSGSTGNAADAARRDFMFQINGYKTANQGGQTMNIYFHYRYDKGIAENDIPNYVDLRKQAITFMDAVDATSNPYWETLNEQMCTGLSNDFPIEAISCQLQVYPDDRPGLPYEPGYHGTVHTIGDIEPLAIPGPADAGHS